MEGKWILFLVIIFSNILFLGFWVMGLIGEVRVMCRTRFPRFYLCFCLCYRRSKLEEEKKHAKAFELNENLVDEIDEVLMSKFA